MDERNEIIEQLDQMEIEEVHNLEETEGGNDMLVGGLIGAGAAALVGLAIWGVNKLRKSKKKEDELEEDPISEKEYSEVEKESKEV